MQTKKNKKEEARARRENLKNLTKALKLAALNVDFPDWDGTANGLLRIHYAKAGHVELHTFDEWQEKGFTVRKGEKAICLWGRPRPLKKKEEAAAQDSEEKGKEDFFPLAYLFSAKQVERK